MAKNKYRIAKITENNPVAERIPHFSDHEGDVYVLVDKDGNIFIDEDNQLNGYMTSIGDKDLSVIEAYCYLKNVAEYNDLAFKTYDALDLLTKDFSKTEIKVPEGNIDFYIESYNQEFVKEGTEPKQIQRLRRSLISIYRDLHLLEKRMKKMADYMDKLEDRRSENGYDFEGKIENPQAYYKAKNPKKYLEEAYEEDIEEDMDEDMEEDEEELEEI